MGIFIFQIIILIFSVVIHEVSHGLMAEHLGDDTARKMGRLTLNPLRHIDPMGSIVVPLVLAIPALFGQPTILFGWAKPVPYNPRNLKKPEEQGALIASAGPASNLLLALVFGILYRILPLVSMVTYSPAISALFSMIVEINIALGIFNLVPIPPLDGSKILFPFLPRSAEKIRLILERYGFLILLVFIFFGFDFLYPIMNFLYHIFTGA